MTITTVNNNKITAGHALAMCGVGALFYMYSFIQRIMPSAMTHELMAGLNMNAQNLGLLVGCIYYGYMLLQIPVGLLFDRFPARLLLTIAPLLCALGAFLFASSHTVDFANVGGFLMGVGQAFSFIGVLVLAGRAYSPRYFGFIVGSVQLLGSIGALIAQAPMAWLVNHIGWRTSVFGLAALGLVIALAFWLIVRDPPQRENSVVSAKSTWQSLRLITWHRQNLWLAIYSFCIWAPAIIFGGLWAVPYLMSLYHVSNILAAAATSMIWIGAGLGSPLFGWWSDRIGQRRLPLITSAIISLITGVIILYVPDLSWWQMNVLLLLFGVGGSGQTLSFAVSKDLNPPALAATAVGLNNTAVVLGGTLLQPLVGILLHQSSAAVAIHGVIHYSVANYQFALSVAPLCALLALITVLLFLKETQCEPQYRI